MCFLAFFLLMVSGMMTSCRSTHSLTEAEEVSVKHFSDSSSVDWQMNKRIEDILVRDISLDEGWNADFIVYLPPDSSGRQAIRAKGKINKQSKRQLSEQTTHNKDETAGATEQTRHQASTNRESHIKEADSKSAHPVYWKILLYGIIIFATYYIISRKWPH